MPNRAVSTVIGQRPIPSAGIAATVRDAAKIMKECHSSAVLVVDKGVLVGICTERDIVFRVVAAHCDPAHTRVDAVMTHKLRTIRPEQPFGLALHLMFAGGFRHLPVVDADHHPLGLLTAHDALDIDCLRLEQELVSQEEITVIL